MKKFNFFPVLLVALFMVLGLTAQAQTYFPSQKALGVVENQLVILKKTYPQASVGDKATQDNVAFTVHSMKVVVGESMLEPLKLGNPTESVLSATFARINPGSNQTRKAIVAEVELFYKNLLKVK